MNFSFPQNFLFKENFLPHPHKAATHNACALVRAMASNAREANTDDERALVTAAEKKDVETLTSLLQKGVCNNVYDNVCGHEKKREKECEEEKEEEEGGEMREREGLAHFLFSSLIITFFSGLCKFSLSLLSLDAVMTCKGRSICVRERVWRTSALERERRGERENKRKKEREREEGERGRKRERVFSFLFTFPSFQYKVRFTSDLFLDAQ